MADNRASNCEGESPFGRSGKVKRSPPGSSRQWGPSTPPVMEDSKGEEVVGRRKAVSVSAPPVPFKTPESPAEKESGGTKRKELQRSPWDRTPPLGPSDSEADVLRRQVDDCGLDEEEKIVVIKGAVKRIREAIGRQKNISRSVQDAIAEIEEAVSAITEVQKVRKKALREERQILKKQARLAQQPLTKRQRMTSGGKSEVLERVEKSTMTTPPSKKSKVGKKGKGGTGTPMSEAGNSQVRTPRQAGGPPQVADDGFMEVKSKSALRREKKRRKAAARLAQATSRKNPHKGRKEGATEPRRAAPGERMRNILLIKPGAGKSYAEVVGKLRKDIRPEDSGVEVRRLRKTNDGGVLIELGSAHGQSEFAEAVKKVLGSQDTLKSVTPRLRVEVMDLDSCTTQEEVSGALKRELGDGLGDFKVFLTRPNAREQRIAVVDICAPTAQKLLRKGNLKVGWVICRVRIRVEVPRCFRCLEYGHTRRQCKGPDRSEACWRCGGNGHKSSSCEEVPSCTACKNTTDGRTSDHVQGSGACRTFRDLLVSRKESRRSN